MSAEEAAWVPYRERPDWADVTPIPQEEGPNPVVAIGYSDEFVDVMDYFRGIVASGEKSQRAIDITHEVIARNGASCTGWHWRWLCLQSTDANLLKELEYCDHLSTRYTKNYQLWYHRRLIVESIGISVAQREIKYLDGLLVDDSKNYHMWSHRQWLVRTYGLWDEDLALVNSLIRIDLRNNSAWNERYFIMTRGGTDMAHLLAAAGNEREYTSTYIEKAPDNESAWTYARALPSDPAMGVSPIAVLVPLATNILEAHSHNVHALSLMAEAAVEQIAMAAHSKEQEQAALLAISYYKKLIEVDPMRVRYWAWCLQNIPQPSKAA
mmetsp:Transcript_44980/g.75047  ORF Transcript_44980/g.75047 Transcript_44980/m.75047 type:complete len:324 (-) Transcript_44980:71-1042(-)